jgi:hypothetical protein
MGASVYPVPGSIRSKQRGTIAISSGQDTATATVSAVTTAKARLTLTGWISNSTGAPVGTDMPSISLTSSTQITASRASSSTVVVTVSYELEEVY